MAADPSLPLWVRVTRDLASVAAGLFGLVWEATHPSTSERLWLLIVCGGLLLGPGYAGTLFGIVGGRGLPGGSDDE